MALHRHDEAIARVRVVPEAVTRALSRARDEGLLDPAVELHPAGEVLTAAYVDTLSRWLDAADPWPLADTLRDRIELVMAGLRPRGTRGGSRD